jgi:hypothetical protein
MDFGLLATVQSVVWLIVGGAFLLAPRQWVAPFNVQLGPEAVVLARLFGSALLSLAVLDFLGRDATDTAVPAIAFANATANGLSALLHAVDQLGARVLNALGWGVVALNGVFAVLWLLAALA